MGRSCFIAGTPLLTPSGHKVIELFRVGDLILSRSERNPDGKAEAKTVEEVFVSKARVVHLLVGGRLIATTTEHPFWVRGKGWQMASELGAGDQLTSHDGQWVEVERVSDTGQEATVYNLRIRDYHTYFVGARHWGFSVWAHNAECWNAFGNRSGPRPPRPGKDIAVDANGMVHPTKPPTGASLYGDVNHAPLSGPYHTIPGDAPLPNGVTIIPDGVDVGGIQPPTHGIFSPTESMTFADFVTKFLGLGWVYGGKK